MRWKHETQFDKKDDVMKRYKKERHAQFHFYLPTLSKHELVLELFEQAQALHELELEKFSEPCVWMGAML